MKIKRIETAIIATTHIDCHNERLTKEALEGMAEQISRKTIPINVEHNPLFPPIGKVVSASVKPTEDGEYALVATLEIFDEASFVNISDSILVMPPANAITIPEVTYKECLAPEELKIELKYDPRNYSEEEVKLFASSTAKPISVKDQQIGRKAFTPPSIIYLSLLTIPLYFFAKGFFTRLGERLADRTADELADTYKSFKTKLIKLLKSRTQTDTPILLIDFQHPESDVQIEAAVQSENEIVAHNYLDKIQELYTFVGYFLRSNSSHKFKKIQFIFDPATQSWKVNYLITESGQIILGDRRT
jgi:hypothetical protein